MEGLLFLALVGVVVGLMGGRQPDGERPLAIYLVRPEPDLAPSDGSFSFGLVLGVVLTLMLIVANTSA